MDTLLPLTPEQFERARRRLLHPPPGSRMEAARKYGIDLTLLVEQLRLTPAERARNLEQIQNGMVFTLNTDLGAIDLLAEVAGLGAYEQVKAHSIMVDAFDRRFATLDLPGLIRSKRAAGRERDVEALPELESLLEAEEPE